MEIFTNWIFWVVLAAIVFIFALIGFFAESSKKKKNKKDDKINNQQTDTLNQNITKAPEDNILNLDSANNNSPTPEIQNQTNSQNNVELSQSAKEETPIEKPQTIETVVPEPVQSEPAPEVKPVESTPEMTNSQNPQNLPEIDQQVTDEAATLFDNDDDNDVWKV